MTELGPVAWPPAPIRTERLVLGIVDLVAVWGDGTVHLYPGDGNGHLSAGPAMWPDNTWSTMGLIA